MKLLLGYLSILSGVFAATVDKTRDVRGPSDSLRQMLENLKKQMPCGFPEYGLPPLAPFKAEIIEINVNESFVFGHVNLYKLVIDGLDNFDIIDVSFNLLTLKSTFDINMKEIRALGQYDLNLDFPETMTLSGNGGLNLTLKDLRFKGNLRLGAKLSGVQLKEFHMTVSLGAVESNITGLAEGGVVNEIINKVIEKVVMDIIKKEDKLISQKIHDFILPKANSVLKKYTLSEIIRMITKPGTPKECIPPSEVEFHQLTIKI